MAINVDASTARIADHQRRDGGLPHRLALRAAPLHQGCQSHGRRPLARRQGEAVRRVELEGSVFLDATPTSSTSATARSAWCKRRKWFYEFVYAGRRDTEGSCNSTSGPVHRQSLARRAAERRTVDRRHDLRCCDAAHQRVTTPKIGFNVTVRFGDHPHNTIPYRFQTQPHQRAQFFSPLAARAQKFNAISSRRANRPRPSRSSAASTWRRTGRRIRLVGAQRQADRHHAARRHSRGRLRQGAPNPPDASSRIVVARSLPTANNRTRTRKRDLNRRRAPCSGIPKLAAGLPHQFLHLTLGTRGAGRASAGCRTVLLDIFRWSTCGRERERPPKIKPPAN